MLVGSPVVGTIKPDKKNYPDHPLAVKRPSGSTIPLVTHDFGPSDVEDEPTIVWAGGESNIFGTPIAPKKYFNFHLGIDISTGACTGDVLAAAKGTVKFADADSSGANVIVITHGMIDGHLFETRYAHLKSPLIVKKGDPVTAGMVIGKIGGTGSLSTACHLHFAITKDGNPVDPWRRLTQNATNDPDSPVASLEGPDVPIPASNNEYVAGQVAVVGNTTLGAIVRTKPKKDASVVRTIQAGVQESWLPTCWVKGDTAFESDRWLTRWNNGQWEFTHFNNVRSVTPL